MNLELEFSIMLDKKAVNFNVLKTTIKDFLKKQKIQNYFEQNDKEVFWLNFFTTKEIFTNLENEINDLFDVLLSNMTNINYPHYHLTRYRDDTDEIEIIHESIAINLKQGYWEVYYQDGNLQKINKQRGTLKDYGIFLFKVTLKEEDDIVTSLDNAFDTWLLQEGNR